MVEQLDYQGTGGMAIRNFTDKDVPELDGRVFFVTGANSGLGYETARVLAGKGSRVLMGCRSEARATDAMDRIRADFPKADLKFVPLDLGDLQSIHEAAGQVAREPRLDVLVNNAGIMMPPREETADGFESQFGVNHLGTFALTGLLLNKLAEGEQPRVVITSSMAHRSGRIDFDDINAEESYSWPTLAAAAAPDVESAQYFGPSRTGEWVGPAREVQPRKYAKRIEPAKHLWRVSEEMTGVKYSI